MYIKNLYTNKSQVNRRAALTWDFIEILAQRYAISKTSTYNREAMQFHHGADEVKTRVENIWAQAYSLP